jgi:glycosyltransferase involved in cell wall biosynthesis
MISVIIPVYNGEKFIPRILDSFKKQIYQDFELIFIDDGSNDQSYAKLIQKQKETSLNIKVIKQSNQGVSKARNTGLDSATGEYICFVDVDDEVSPEYLSFQYNIIKNYDCDLIICGSTFNKEDFNSSKYSFDNYDTYSALNAYLFGRIKTGVCTLLVKSKVIQNNQLRFANGFKYSEDLHMVWRIISCAKMIICTNKKLYHYIANHGSAMDVFNEDRFHGVQLMRDLEAYFQKYNPKFYLQFRKYAAAKMMWSILWQSALWIDNRNEFFHFNKKYNFKQEIKKLVCYKNKTVCLSSILFLTSQNLFYFLVRFMPINGVKRRQKLRKSGSMS